MSNKLDFIVRCKGVVNRDEEDAMRKKLHEYDNVIFIYDPGNILEITHTLKDER